MNNKTQFIPWYETKDICNARSVLHRSIDSLKNKEGCRLFQVEEEIRKFILKNCNHLLSSESDVDKSNTSIPAQSTPLSFSLDKLSNTNSTENVPGVYILTEKSTGIFYIGSAISIHGRFNSHKASLNDNLRKGEDKTGGLFYKHILTNGGWDNYTWTIIKTTPNYLELFIKQNPHFELDSHLSSILELFITFEVRRLEQALIYYYQPALK